MMHVQMALGTPVLLLLSLCLMWQNHHQHWHMWALCYGLWCLVWGYWHMLALCYGLWCLVWGDWHMLALCYCLWCLFGLGLLTHVGTCYGLWCLFGLGLLTHVGTCYGLWCLVWGYWHMLALVMVCGVWFGVTDTCWHLLWFVVFGLGLLTHVGTLLWFVVFGLGLLTHVGTCYGLWCLVWGYWHMLALVMVCGVWFGVTDTCGHLLWFVVFVWFGVADTCWHLLWFVVFGLGLLTHVGTCYGLWCLFGLGLLTHVGTCYGLWCLVWGYWHMLALVMVCGVWFGVTDTCGHLLWFVVFVWFGVTDTCWHLLWFVVFGLGLLTHVGTCYGLWCLVWGYWHMWALVMVCGVCLVWGYWHMLALVMVCGVCLVWGYWHMLALVMVCGVCLVWGFCFWCNVSLLSVYLFVSVSVLLNVCMPLYVCSNMSV